MATPEVHQLSNFAVNSQWRECWLMGLILMSGTDLRASCILAKTCTTELHPTAVDSFFIPHLVHIVRGKEVFSSQQPLERRVPAILSSLDHVQTQQWVSGWGTLPHCGWQNKNTPIGSWIWKLSHQGVELISEDHRDIARLKSERRSKGAWDRRTWGLSQPVPMHTVRPVRPRPKEQRTAEMHLSCLPEFDLQHWIKVGIVTIPVLGKRKQEDHRFKAILGYVVTQRPQK